MVIAVTSARFEVRGLRARVIRLLKIHTQDAFVKMENCDQRVIIFFALCPLSCAIIRGVIRARRKEQKTTKGTDRNEQRNGNSLCDGYLGYGNTCFAYAKLSKQRLFKCCRGSCLSKV